MIFFHIQDIVLQGISTSDSEMLQSKMNDVLNTKKLFFLKPYNNIIFFPASRLANEFLDNYPKFESITAKKHFFHRIEFSFSERSAVGIWCMSNGCKYFDAQGVQWGDAPQSSGPLLLIVKDMRADVNEIDKDFLPFIHLAVKQLSEFGISVSNVHIPADTFHEFWVFTGQGYRILFDLDTNILNQLEVLNIFLDENGITLATEYIDLRIDGRVYHK